MKALSDDTRKTQENALKPFRSISSESLVLSKKKKKLQGDVFTILTIW